MSEPTADVTSEVTPELPPPPTCEPSETLDVRAHASPGTQVQVGTTIHLTGIAKGTLIQSDCSPIPEDLTFQWQLLFQAPGGGVVDVTSSLQNPGTLHPSFLANSDGTFWVNFTGNGSLSDKTVQVVITVTPLPPVLVSVSGHVTSLRANDIGDGFGPPDDFIEVEAVVQLDTQIGKSFGFELRNDKNRPARQSMFDLLLSAFNNNWKVSMDCFIVPSKNNGTIIQATLTKQ